MFTVNRNIAFIRHIERPAGELATRLDVTFHGNLEQTVRNDLSDFGSIVYIILRVYANSILTTSRWNKTLYDANSRRYCCWRSSQLAIKLASLAKHQRAVENVVFVLRSNSTSISIVVLTKTGSLTSIDNISINPTKLTLSVRQDAQGPGQSQEVQSRQFKINTIPTFKKKKKKTVMRWKIPTNPTGQEKN